MKSQLRRIATRDQWTCWLCEQRVDQDLPDDHPRRASLDHVIPVALGGTGTDDNLRLAHAACNTHRGATLRGLSVADRVALRDTGHLPTRVAA